MRIVFLTFVTTVLLHPTIVAAQTAPYRFDIFAGLSLSKFAVSNADFETPMQLTGFSAGLSMLIQRSERFAWQPEIMLTQKGYRYAESGTIQGYVYADEGKATVSYLELPLLARLSLTASDAEVAPFILGGPAIALKLGCTYEYELRLFGPGIDDTSSDSGKCEDAEDAAQFNSFDFGIVLGGGVKYRNLSFQARYDLGLSGVVTGVGFPDVRNRAIMLLVGLALGGQR